MKIRNRRTKLMSLDAVLDAISLRDGMTISFHHHYRNGDVVVNLVMKQLEREALKIFI